MTAWCYRPVGLWPIAACHYIIMKKSIFGILIMMESLLLVLSAAVSAFYREGQWQIYLMTAAAAFVIGLGCKVAGEREKEKRLTRADSFLVVTLSWVVFSVIGAIPYIFIAGMDVHAAFFEAMSGFTTTGATCISDVDAMPKGLLFWRSLTHWIGGLGIVVFSFALIPSYDMRSSNVFSAEVTGLGVDKLRPKIGDTARRLLLIYLFLTAVCALCYWLGPMDTYDSVCHAMSTIATGGFSTHTASIGYFHSAYIEYVCCFFMFLSSVNFSLFYYASVGRPGTLWRNEETKTFFGIAGASVLLFIVLFMFATSDSCPSELLPHGLEETFRSSLFHVSSIMSSTGFAAQKFDYVSWGSAFWGPTVTIMAIGACAGSTAGGIKVLRILISMKTLFNELVLQLHPRAVLSVRVNGHVVSEEKVRRTLTFVFVYLLLVALGAACHGLMGADVDTCVGASICTLSNVGPGTGTVGPACNFASILPAGKWLMSFYMLVGRLEIFTVLFLFMPHYWKERR